METRARTRLRGTDNEQPSLQSKPSTVSSKIKVKSKNIEDLTKEECEIWAESFYLKDGEIYAINPITNNHIKASGGLNKKIIENCFNLHKITPIIPQTFQNFLDNITYKDIKKWFDDVTVNPFNNEKIEIGINSDLPYSQLYLYSFERLIKYGIKDDENKGMTDEEILKLMPKNHIVLKDQLDFLYYKVKTKKVSKKIYNGNDKKYNDYYDIIYNDTFNKMDLKYFEDFANFDDIFINSCIKPNINAVIIEINRLIKELISIINDTENIKRRFLNIKNRFNIYYELIKIKEVEGDINKYIKEVYKIPLIKIDNDIGGYPTYLEQSLYLEHFHKALIDIDNLFNYETSGVIINHENIILKEMEDPLISILNSEEYRDIDLDNLELPTRLFENDKEYNKYLNEYNKLKDEYEQEKKKYFEEYDRLEEKNKKLSPQQRKILKPPLKKILKLPENKTIMIDVPFPRYINDEEYDKLKEHYKSKKSIIDKYKNFIKLGFFSLTKKSKKSNIRAKLFDKSIQQIYEEDLNNNDDDDRTKCNSNKDGITQEEFNSPEYPYAKLQLMVKLHTRDEKGNIVRTDCFYAPNIYNYLIERAKNNDPFLNPITKQKLTDENINDIMDTVNVIDETLKVPEYIKPKQDTKIKIGYKYTKHKGESFYKIYIYREFGLAKFEIIDLCCVLGGIGINETKSADLSSENMMHKIFKLFNDGMLLDKYILPLNNGLGHIKPSIHFNNFRTEDKWIKNREEQIYMLIHYGSEINNYI